MEKQNAKGLFRKSLYFFMLTLITVASASCGSDSDDDNPTPATGTDTFTIDGKTYEIVEQLAAYYKAEQEIAIGIKGKDSNTSDDYEPSLTITLDNYSGAKEYSFNNEDHVLLGYSDKNDIGWLSDPTNSAVGKVKITSHTAQEIKGEITAELTNVLNPSQKTTVKASFTAQNGTGQTP